MALIEYNFLPGINKQDTTAGAENRWIDSDNVRFRYGLPEKVGGWSSLIADTIKGKGVSYMEGKWQYHTIIPKSDKDINTGLKELS